MDLLGGCDGWASNHDDTPGHLILGDLFAFMCDSLRSGRGLLLGICLPSHWDHIAFYVLCRGLAFGRRFLSFIDQASGSDPGFRRG